MELWNRTYVAIVTILGALLCGIIVLSALLARIPDMEPSFEQARRRPTIPAPQNLPEDTRQAIALRALELATARARIAELESNSLQYQQRIRELQQKLRQIDEQFTVADLERHESLQWLTTLLASGEQGTNVHPPGAEPSEISNSADSDADAESPELDTLERQLELEGLREQVTALRTLLKQLQTEADMELAELHFRKQELGKTTAELFARLGEAGLPILLEALESPEPLVRQWAADSLRALGPSGQTAIPYLSLALDDPDEQVRLAARDALAAIRD